MSETHDTTSLHGLNSVAERLKAAGFRQTGIARAVTELVGEYLGIHANIGTNLTRALGVYNAAASEVLGVQPSSLPINAANDPHFGKPDALNTANELHFGKGSLAPAANDSHFKKSA
ncbi:hypothetical protein HOO68_03215 [Candidatus Gracilibacteria bacterium]|nr:hypothetical protein [Candidatus Gracilibacteria bacterium]